MRFKHSGWAVHQAEPRDQPTNRSGSGLSFLFASKTASGQNVNEHTAMQVSAVYACVRLLSEAIASLPLHVYKYNEDGGKERVPQHPLFRILYALKTGMSRAKLARLMEQETWMNARKAIEWGFADGILDDPKHRQPDDTAYSFSRRAVTNSLLDKLQPKAVQAIPAVVVQAPTMPDALPPNPGTPAESLAKRLSLISH